MYENDLMFDLIISSIVKMNAMQYAYYIHTYIAKF